MRKEFARRSKAHQKYILKDGTPVPGVTTITKYTEPEKGGMVHAAWKLGYYKKINYREHWNELKNIGTLTHEMILCHLKNEKCNTDEYSKRMIDLAENSFISYLEWEKHHEIKPHFLEKQLISEKYKFGGTIDFLGWVDRVYMLIDFKTGKTYPEHWYQIAGYHILATEIGLEVENHKLIRIGREENEEFEEPEKKDIKKHINVFLRALELHYALGELK